MATAEEPPPLLNQTLHPSLFKLSPSISTSFMHILLLYPILPFYNIIIIIKIIIIIIIRYNYHYYYCCYHYHFNIKSERDSDLSCIYKSASESCLDKKQFLIEVMQWVAASFLTGHTIISSFSCKVHHLVVYI